MGDLSVKRDDLRILVNEPVKITIGTADEPLTIEIREPTNAEIGDALTRLNAMLRELVVRNMTFIQGLLAGKDPKELPLDISNGMEAIYTMVAFIIGKDEAFVRQTMTPRQTAAVWKAWLDMLGWDVIWATFLAAVRAFKAGDETATETPTPPWRAEGSSN